MSKLSAVEKRRQAVLARWYNKMAWYAQHPVARRRMQLERLAALMNFYKQDQAARLAETRKLFGRPVCLVDIHTHTLHSDGWGSVAENSERVRFCGLDFFFATDHERLTQRPFVKRLDNAGWGQEPPIGGGHHLGVLSNTRYFRPRRDTMPADFNPPAGAHAKPLGKAISYQYNVLPPMGVKPMRKPGSVAGVGFITTIVNRLVYAPPGAISTATAKFFVQPQPIQLTLVLLLCHSSSQLQFITRTV